MPDETPSSGLEINAPWHRWFIADGSIGGYGGKTELGLKRWLGHEGARA